MNPTPLPADVFLSSAGSPTAHLAQHYATECSPGQTGLHRPLHTSRSHRLPRVLRHFRQPVQGTSTPTVQRHAAGRLHRPPPFRTSPLDLTALTDRPATLPSSPPAAPQASQHHTTVYVTRRSSKPTGLQRPLHPGRPHRPPRVLRHFRQRVPGTSTPTVQRHTATTSSFAVSDLASPCHTLASTASGPRGRRAQAC